MLRPFAVAAVAAAVTVALAGTAAAQDQDVTVLLKSGERVTGQLASFDQSTIDIRGASGQRQSLQWNDVVLLDFVGGARSLSSSEVNATTQPQNTIVLRGGQTQQGRIIDFVNEGGPDAKVIVESQGQGRQEYQLNRVQRIYVNPFTPEATAAAGLGSGTQAGASQPGTSGSISGEGLSITIPGSTRWIGTGIFVRRGDRLSIQSEGTVYLRSGNQDPATPAGATAQRRATGAPLANELAGALIGRVGQGQPFGIGNQSSITAPASGELFLGINDDEFSDNSGQYSVRISRPQAGVRR